MRPDLAAVAKTAEGVGASGCGLTNFLLSSSSSPSVAGTPRSNLPFESSGGPDTADDHVMRTTAVQSVREISVLDVPLQQCLSQPRASKAQQLQDDAREKRRDDGLRQISLERGLDEKGTDTALNLPPVILEGVRDETMLGKALSTTTPHSTNDRLKMAQVSVRHSLFFSVSVSLPLPPSPPFPDTGKGTLPTTFSEPNGLSVHEVIIKEWTFLAAINWRLHMLEPTFHRFSG
ncbi:MAG: hypothetical protein M1826_002843 [Phylliscum demangeonii]|nr:MAG: hypothetical protein M1826_002843 [Phylliscum demangeonii]